MIVADIYPAARQIFGNCAQATVFEWLSDAIESLANKGNWDPITCYLDIQVSNGNFLVLPDFVEVPLKVNINKKPSFARGRLFEFRQNTDGSVLGDELGFAWADRGEQPYQVTPPESFQVKADQENAIRVYGLDTENKEIFDSSGIPGYLATTNLAGPTFSRILSVKKLATTTYASLYANDILIAQYEPKYYTPLFRVMHISQQAAAVRMLVRRKNYRVQSLEDFIPLHSHLAIKLMCNAVFLWRMGQQPDVADNYVTQAVKLLTEEQNSRNSHSSISDQTEVITCRNQTYQTRECIVVGDLYDQACEIFGGIGRQKIFDRITDAIELMANKSNWDGLTGYLDICGVADDQTRTYGYCDFTLPDWVETVLKVNNAGWPTYGQNKWFEFHQNGMGSCRGYLGWTWQDRGDFPTFRDIQQPSRLVVALDTAFDNNVQIRIYGYDEKGRWITQDGKDGFLIPAVFGYALPDPSLPLVSKITRVVKTETNGFVRVSALDESSSEGKLIALMRPDEVEPSYRRIRVSYMTNWIRALVRKKTYRIRNITDVIPLYSKLCMVAAMKAIAALNAGDAQTFSLQQELALTLLNEEQEMRNPLIDAPQEFDYISSPGSVYNMR
jgi:uncharacterized membrane protein